ncbi:MAG: FHA domain-containing protein [bacterium]|nr:FHA domain-containing protein [bacterium]
MTDRYSLRIETGGRAGELVPLTHSPFLIGRSPECNLSLTEASVSGRHAELRQLGDKISLHDLGSTNGTRIGRLKVGEAELESGLAFSVGDVRLTLVLESAAAPAVSDDASEPTLETDEISLEEPDAPPSMQSGNFAVDSVQTKIQPGFEDSLGSQEVLDEAGQVSADQLARASRRSPVALAGLVVLLLAAGGSYFYFGQGGGDGPIAPEETRVAGDLLAGQGTFEDAGNSAWQAKDGWNAQFHRSRAAAKAGTAGLTCELLAGERAQHLGPIVNVSTKQGFDLSASVRVKGDVIARLGLRWSAKESTDGDGPATLQNTIAWGPLVQAGDGFQDYQLAGTAPAGYSQAQVCIAAWGKGELQEGEDAEVAIAGNVDVDSVAWLQSGPGEASVSLHEMDGFLLGDPGTAFVLHKIDRVLLSGVHCLRERSGYQALAEPIEVRSAEHGMLLACKDGGAGQWIFTAAPRLAAGGVSTMGGAGYLARSLDFTDSHVTDLVLGSGVDLIRISFGGPVAVNGGARSGCYRFSVQVPQDTEVLVKTEFKDELKLALDLSADAQKATREGRVGEALALWKQLLDRYPYEADDVARADAARSTLLNDGRSAIKTLNEELERARFFQLRMGFEGCWQDAVALKQRYAGSDLEASVDSIMEDIETARSQFPEPALRGKEHREALIHVLREQGAEALASKAEATASSTGNAGGH